jgi:hypothetical protein
LNRASLRFLLFFNFMKFTQISYDVCFIYILMISAWALVSSF